MRAEVLALVMLLSTAANADVVRPADPDPPCPAGSRRISLGAGKRICTPVPCATDAECTFEHAYDHKVCRPVEFCTLEMSYTGEPETTANAVLAEAPPSCPLGSRPKTFQVCVPPGSAPPPVKPSSGCGCNTAESRPMGLTLALAVGLALLRRARSRATRNRRSELPHVKQENSARDVTESLERPGGTSYHRRP